jgi:hypothetical protein
LPGPRLVFEPGRIEPSRTIFLGEIEVDRHRLPEDEPIIVDDRNLPIGVEREKPGLARLA